MKSNTAWHQKLIEYIYTINDRLAAEPNETIGGWCKRWGGYDFDGTMFTFRSDDFEFQLGAMQDGRCVLLGECRLWLIAEQYKPFEMMSINLLRFIEDNNLNLDSPRAVANEGSETNE